MSCADAGSNAVRRFEVFTGAGRRREWSEETKASIVAESYSGLESVCAVARRHGLSQSQLFTWRREGRRTADPQLGMPTGSPQVSVVAAEPLFVPAVVETTQPAAALLRQTKPRRRCALRAPVPAVELEIGGISVRIAKGTDAGTITAVIEALKSGA